MIVHSFAFSLYNLIIWI